jgi:hypothetical protein
LALVKTKTKFKTPLVVAIDSFVTTAIPEFGPFSVSTGMRLKADHPVVQRVPDFFTEDGQDDATIASLRAALYRDSLPPAEPPKPVVPAERRLRDEDALVNRFNGQRVAKKDPEAKRRPDWFVPVVGPGLTRENSLLALTEMSEIGAGDKPTRTVHAGQWVSRDDPFVTLHPHSFQALMPGTAEPAEAPQSTRTEA